VRAGCQLPVTAHTDAIAGAAFQQSPDSTTLTSFLRHRLQAQGMPGRLINIPVSGIVLDRRLQKKASVAYTEVSGLTFSKSVPAMAISYAVFEWTKRSIMALDARLSAAASTTEKKGDTPTRTQFAYSPVG